jgi:hypothetical protein
VLRCFAQTEKRNKKVYIELHFTPPQKTAAIDINVFLWYVGFVVGKTVVCHNGVSRSAFKNCTVA